MEKVVTVSDQPWTPSSNLANAISDFLRLPENCLNEMRDKAVHAGDELEVKCIDIAMRARQGLPPEESEAERVARTPQGFQYLDTLKDKTLLVIYQAKEDIMPADILQGLRDSGAVSLDYKPETLSPRITHYRQYGLIEKGLCGWRISHKGRERLLRKIAARGR